MSKKVEKSRDEWAKSLTPEQLRVLRDKGTERPFSGEYNAHKEDGTYHCSGCGELLFDANEKYDSGSGWPSFWQAANPDAVEEEVDSTLGMVRTEVLCEACGGHLGHVFPDGPKPTGQRYCVNSASLSFKPRDEN